MQIEKTLATPLIISIKQKLILGLTGLLLLGYAVFYSQQAVADTNISGVEIEVIGEAVVSDFTGDPVQGFLSEVDDYNKIGRASCRERVSVLV